MNGAVRRRGRASPGRSDAAAAGGDGAEDGRVSRTTIASAAPTAPARPPDLPPASARIAESATLAVDAKAKALKAAGRPVIGFGAGEPDFPTPDYIVEAAVAACRDPRTTATPRRRACPSCGRRSRPRRCATPATRSTPAQVLVTNGGKQAVYQAFATLLDPGDEVLLPAPYWTTYPEAIRLAGGVPVEVFADEDQGYLVTVEQLEAARTDRTKVLLFVSPSNPTGAVYSPEQVRAIGRWAARARPLGGDRRDLRAPRLRRRPCSPRSPAWCPSSPTPSSSSTASPRPTP